jgi:biopolymer transport protein ExbD
MAELDTTTSGHKKGRGVKRSKKRSTRIDLTPMVDLGFLLITFFIFTTTITTPHALRVFLPKDVPDNEKRPRAESSVITLLPAKNNLIYYYEGLDPARLNTADYTTIRNILLAKKNRTGADPLEVIIKLTADANYKNAVDILDEMTIDNVPHYVLVEPAPEELTIVKAQP